MSRHLVKEGNTIGWKENPTEEDYILTYNTPNTIGWKQGRVTRLVLTKDNGLVGWRSILPREIFPGEVMVTQQASSGMQVNYGWGNLPTGYGGRVFSTEGFNATTAWDPASGTYVFEFSAAQGIATARFGVDVHLEIEFVVGDGPHPQMLYKGDVPAGTLVGTTGFGSPDNLFHISVSGLFNLNHHHDGVIEVRATKL